MSATLTPADARPSVRVASPPHTRRRRELSDRTTIGILILLLVAIAALSWRKWGMPEGDAGSELTTADLIKHGAVVYRDVRYFYGPLGVYLMALWFKVAGTSLTTAYAFGFAQAIAILAVFYTLARQWLAPLAAGLSTAVLLAIGFSGTSFNFILPHTNSATFGILTVLLMVLALRRRRLLATGFALGLVALTRPEFLAVAAGGAVAYMIAAWRVESGREAARALWRIALPACVIPLLVFGWFASRAGLHNVLFNNLWPVDFLRVAGLRMQANWMPVSLAGAFGLLARAAAYLGALGALVLSAEGFARRRGWRRALAVWPLAAVGFALVLGDQILRATALFTSDRIAIQTEVRHLILGMSWLPALGLGMFLWAVVRLWRRRDAPLSGSWPADFALIVVAVGLGLRAYNAFTAEGSYAPYYAAPLVLLLGILHVRLAERRPRARAAVLGALGAVALGLATYAVVGLYRHLNTPVHTPRGTFVTFASAAPALQATVRAVDADTRPGDTILAAPLDGGMYFFADRRPASYSLTLLPGLLADRSDEDREITRLRHDHARVAVLGARDFSLWRTSAFGVGYDRLVGDYLRHSAASTTTFGTLAHPVAGTFPSDGYQVLVLKPR
ncbi:MAG: hypothetical protein ACR2NR_12560 [Solirubrobacteraceae bacterium]